MTEEKKKAPAKKKEELAAPKTEEKPKKEEAPKAPAKEEAPKKGEATKEEPKKGKEKKGEEEEEKKIIKESVHTINLRKAYDCPRTSRAKYAVREIKRYIQKHTRKEPVIGTSVNEALWEKGIQSPPRRIRVKIQEEEERATAVLA